MRTLILIVAVSFFSGLGHAANREVVESTSVPKWQEWVKYYPESADYDGGPLKLLASIPLGMDGNGAQVHATFAEIKEKYPDSKLIPYVDYELAISTSELAAVATRYKTERFPAVCGEFLTAWKHLPSPGVKIGALAQMRIADKYFSPYEMTLVGGNADVALTEWKKVLEFYPDRSSGKAAAINDDEWRRIVLPAMFSWLEIARQKGDVQALPQIEDEILRLPDLDQGTNYGKRSHAEVYLARATRLAAAKKYQDAETYLRKVAVDYRDVYWGYHGGIGATYYETAGNSAGILPLPQAKEFLKWLLVNKATSNKK